MYVYISLCIHIYIYIYTHIHMFETPRPGSAGGKTRNEPPEALPNIV